MGQILLGTPQSVPRHDLQQEFTLEGQLQEEAVPVETTRDGQNHTHLSSFQKEKQESLSTILWRNKVESVIIK